MNKKASTEAKNEVKIVSAKATETVKAAAEKAADTAKAAAVKTAAVAKEVKEEVKKTAAKTIDRKPSKKVEEKKAEAVTEVYVQFGGRETTLDSVVAKATDSYVADGHRASSIKKLQVYIKPEESAAYYVINDKNAGKVDLF